MIGKCLCGEVQFEVKVKSLTIIKPIVYCVEKLLVETTF